MGTIRIATMKIRIMGPDAADYPDIDLAERGIDIQVNEIDWSKYEQAISNDLPEGWYCKIEEV